MTAVQIATRIDEIDYRQFEAISKKIGTTPANAVRMFVSAFNRAGGFPYQPKIDELAATLNDESAATALASNLSQKTINETR